MTTEETRKDILELLARGKITIDEAVGLLDQSSPEPGPAKAEEQPLKVEVEVDVDKDVSFDTGQDLEIEDIPLPIERIAGSEPRWLRIQVGELDSGKSKVNVNVPFGMVKFGLGIAQMFAPKEYTAHLEQINDVMADSKTGLLVDVEDVESNEHVRIFFE
jgi:hypothetical protein